MPMSRHSSSYSCSCTPSAPHKQHSASHATSSAFSASANPDEDWTKISDLAERRRIQNRIAQRNYRKKLKRRLEDLERRAASSSASASPEQKYAQLDKAALARNKASNTTTSSRRSLDESFLANQGFEYMVPPHSAQPDDKSMFSYQHTRQLSTSPPPLISYSSYSSTSSNQSVPDTCKSNYFSIPITSSDASYLLGPTHGFANYLPNVSPSNIKQEYYEEDDINPFSLSYASMGGVDLPATYNYPTPMALTPALSDSFEHTPAGSPLEYPSYPITPGMPPTPPPQPYETPNPYQKY